MLEYDTDILRFSYSSMTTPAQVFDYNMADRTRILRKMQEVPSGHDPKLYVTRRIQAPAHDGEAGARSPCSITRTRRSTDRLPCGFTATAPMA